MNTLCKGNYIYTIYKDFFDYFECLFYFHIWDTMRTKMRNDIIIDYYIAMPQPPISWTRHWLGHFRQQKEFARLQFSEQDEKSQP